jgi:hypothetical protein
MRQTVSLLIVLIVLVGVSVVCIAQETETQSDVGLSTPSSSHPIKKDVLAINLGPLAADLWYGRRISDTAIRLGAGLWGMWEAPTSFNRNIWNVGGIRLFISYELSRWFHVEAGPSLLRYSWADDCSSCSGTFVGIEGGAFVGYRWIFVGTALHYGVASDDRHGSGSGLIVAPWLRLAIGW